jgi:signal transduction histidine kinase
VTGLLLIPVAAAVTGAIARSLARLASWLLAPDARDALTARVRTLEHTRAGAVESADARLRRLERDLHDGAQHRLAFIAMELDRARGKLAEDPAAAAPLLLQAHEESKRAMGELRDLVRGIHPSVLADRGLDAAISGLAERTRLPVSLHITLPSRPPMAAETAAYYVVAEALTNVCKHADAQSVSVTIAQGVEGLSIEVSDDGRGGARRTAGSGLDGLAQRVEALDGSLAIDSPAGGPTTLRAVIPCAS